jgi:phage/conjugal plasmid C-4 type zinc finger TraR family protein
VSGYTGNADAEAEHAIILAENALHAVRQSIELRDESADECEECGNEIPLARRLALRGVFRCIACQEEHERTYRRPTIKMLDRIL